MNPGNCNPFPTGLDPAQRSADEGGVSFDPYEELVRQMFAVSLDLHAALALVNNRQAVDKIWHAIDGLDRTINQVRHIVLQLEPPVGIADGPDRRSARESVRET